MNGRQARLAAHGGQGKRGRNQHGCSGDDAGHGAGGARDAAALTEIATPRPGPGQLLIRVHACAVCRTDLHIIDGELTQPKLPLIPGHEVVGTVHGTRWRGRPLQGRRSRRCPVARLDLRKLFVLPQWARKSLRLSQIYRLHPRRRLRRVHGCGRAFLLSDSRCLQRCRSRAAALRRTHRLSQLGKAGNGERWASTVSAPRHISSPRWQNIRQREIYAFTRPGDDAAQRFARSLGATWAGGSNDLPPHKLDAAIIFAPAGELIPQALRAVGKGGTVVCGGIHMSDIPSFPYSILWEERTITLGRQPDPPRRRRVPGARPAGAGPHRSAALSPGPGQRGAGPIAGREP